MAMSECLVYIGAYRWTRLQPGLRVAATWHWPTCPDDPKWTLAYDWCHRW